jgi:predicted N-acetyltransferase YhbS
MIIRSTNADDLDFCATCVTREGWLSETHAVFEGFLAHDPRGCFVAEENDERIGMIVATAYDTCGFLGELIVVPERRRQGIGRQLMEHAIGYLQARGCRSIYLDGDTPAVPLYQRLGFRTVCRSLRFLGTLDGKTSERVRQMTPADLGAVCAIDQSAFAADRSFFIRRRFQLLPHLCLLHTNGERLDGFIMGQPGHGVVTGGPWFVADESTDPLVLLRALAHRCEDQRLRVGMLETNVSATAMMRSLQTFEETEPSRRMVLGPDLGLGTSPRLYAVGTPAKG